MVAACFSRTLVTTCGSTWCHKPKDHNLNYAWIMHFLVFLIQHRHMASFLLLTHFIICSSHGRGPKGLQRLRSNLWSLGARRVGCCMWTDTRFCVWGKNCNNYVENIKNPCKNLFTMALKCPGFVHPFFLVISFDMLHPRYPPIFSIYVLCGVELWRTGSLVCLRKSMFSVTTGNYLYEISGSHGGEY
jgi:hypothetical protein